jgi:hypothetical protein
VAVDTPDVWHLMAERSDPGITMAGGVPFKVKPPKCEDCGCAQPHVVKLRENFFVWLCGSCEFRREHPDAPKPVKLPRERTKRLQKETLFDETQPATASAAPKDGSA